ncbi:MAG: S46 family peptidase [Bacteroidales bacterium]|nr:S46 family peptidase [Bacteroidales bacterium]
MKRFFIAAAAMLMLAAPSMRADEGMWLLPLLQKLNSKDLASAGCHLTPEQIYSINHSSLKDAIIQFGGGCTGEVVSDEGLVLTNHHCGYSSIQKLSSVEHDYLKDGYWAASRAQELPVEGLSVVFLDRIVDLSKEMAVFEKRARKEYKDSSNVDSLVFVALQEQAKKIADRILFPGDDTKVLVQSFYDDNMWYAFYYKKYTDIRFVGAPPSSIGKFGADTDNWMWPRHTGDFSMFRIYADPSGNPADYSEDNVPYVPKRSLKISLKGVSEGDYAMVMGYPGSTNRYYTPTELAEELAVDDVRVQARTKYQDIVMKYMLSDPALKIKYADKYAHSSNGWKMWQGMAKACKDYGITDRLGAQAAEYKKWAEGSKKNLKYAKAISDVEQTSRACSIVDLVSTLVNETWGKMEALLLDYSALNVLFAGGSAEISEEAIKAFYDEAKAEFKDYSADVDRDVTISMLEHFRSNAPEWLIPGREHPMNLAQMDVPHYVDSVFSKSIFTDESRLDASYAKGTLAQDAMSDALTPMAVTLVGIAYALFPYYRQLDASHSVARRTYMEGMLKWKKKQALYPDANFTMRLTYGHVKPYSVSDAVTYKYYTTLEGVMEKEDPDNWEFVVPSKLKELYQTKDFGEYAMADGRMPVCFITDNDITGGNSGSPVMDADGNLIGLAFDGNWESLSCDINYEASCQRCICVDIRYVLFIIDKFGGAGYLLDEMNIIR